MSVEEGLEQEKAILIEELGVLMEQKHQLSPLAARIMSTLVLSGRRGVTFDEFVRNLQASKSSVSTHLEKLQATRKIKYFTKPGDRKRYFIINPGLILEVIEETANAWEKEEKVQRKIQMYKERRNQLSPREEQPLFDLEFQKNLIIFLQEATTAIRKLKTQIVKETTEQKN